MKFDTDPEEHYLLLSFDSNSLIKKIMQEVNGDGNDGSYLKCYMREHPEVSIEQARKHVTELISNSWKRLNQECLTDANPLPSSFTKMCLSAARMVPLMYSYDTNSPSKLEEYVKSLLSGGAVHSIPQDQTIVSSNYLTSTDMM